MSAGWPGTTGSPSPTKVMACPVSEWPATPGQSNPTTPKRSCDPKRTSSSRADCSHGFSTQSPDGNPDGWDGRRSAPLSNSSKLGVHPRTCRCNLRPPPPANGHRCGTVGIARYARGMAVFVVTRANGPNYDHSRQRREQDAWPEHALFMDRLLDEGFVIMGGPLDDGQQVLLIVAAADEEEVEAGLVGDPWEPLGILRTRGMQRWDVWLDSRAAVASPSC